MKIYFYVKLVGKDMVEGWEGTDPTMSRMTSWSEPVLRDELGRRIKRFLGAQWPPCEVIMSFNQKSTENN